MMRRSLFSIMASAALALALAGITATSAAETLQMAVSPGFGGAAKLGTWMPVEIDLQNAGSDVVGEVQVQVDGQNGRGAFGRPPTTYSAPVSLPKRSRKRISLDVYLPSVDQKLQAQFVSDGQTLAKQSVPVEQISATEMACGVVAGSRDGLAFLTTLDLGGPQRRVRVAHLDLGDLPSAPHLLQSLDCLIFSNVSTSGLTTQQKDAVQNWVVAGGLLVVGGGAGAQKTLGSLPPDLLPVKVSGSVPVRSLSQLADFVGQPLPETGPWLVGDAVVTDGVALADQDGLPLVVTARRGLGGVVYVGLDLTGEPLASWAGSATFWRRLLAYAPAPQPSFNNLARQYTGWGRLPRVAIADLTGFSRTSTAWLLYLLLGYAVVVGPVNYLALRRLGRPEWSLATLPVVTLLAAGIAFAGARANPASDLVINDVAILRSWDGASAYAHSYVGVFSLREQAPDLDLPAGSLVSALFYPFPSDTPSQGTPPEWSLSIRQGDQPGLTRFALRPGGLGTFAVDRLYRLPGRVSANLVVDETSARGEVVSRLSQPLRDAAVVVGGDVLRLGDLRPGESRPIALALRSSSVDSSAVVKQLYPTAADPGPPEEAARRDLLQAAFSPAAGSGPRVEIGGATLVGWLDQGPLGNPVRSSRTTPLQRALLINSLPLRAQPGSALQVPPSLVVRRSLLGTGGARVSGGSLSFSGGDAVSWEYQLPFDQSQFVVDDLRLDLAGTLSGAASGSLLSRYGQSHLYDWERGDWTAIDLDFGQNRLTDPQRFVSSFGVVRFRYVYRPAPGSLSSSSATFSAFDLIIHGRAR